MAVRFYDEALANKIKNWTKSHPIRIFKPDETAEMFKTIADEKKDQPITLPLITLSRATKITLLNTNKKPMTFDGMKLRIYDKEGNEVRQNITPKLNAIPMKLDYQLDIYTQHQAEADEYMRNFAFNLTNYPNVTIEIPYNDAKITHKSIVTYDSEVEDNSDIPLRLFPTQFTRYTFILHIDDAYIFSVPLKENLLISSVNIDEIKDETKESEEFDVDVNI